MHFITFSTKIIGSGPSPLGKLFLVNGRLKKSQVGQNVTNMIKYQKIYTELITHKIPLLKDHARMKKIKRLGMIKMGLMVSGFVFFLFYSRIGLLNRLTLALVATNVSLFLCKGYSFSRVVEDSSDEMSIVGQEARIQLL